MYQEENIQDSKNGVNPEFGESLFAVLWQRRWLVILGLVISIFAGFVYILKATPIFASVSRIYVEQSGPRIISEQEGVMTRSNNYLYTQAELLRSTPILTNAIDTMRSGLRTFDNIDNKMVYLKKGLSIEVGKKDDIISISFESPYPDELPQIVNAVVDSYITYQSQRKRSTSAEVLTILQNEKTRRNVELTSQLEAMMEYKKQNPSLAFESRQGNVIIEQLARLAETLSRASLHTIEAGAKYESTKSLIETETGLSQFFFARGGQEQVNFVRLNDEISQLEIQLADLSNEVTANHPSLQKLENRLKVKKEELQSQYSNLAQSELAVAKEEYLSAKQIEEQIKKQYDQQRQQAIELNEQLAHFRLLESAWQQTKNLSDIVDSRIKELSVTEDAGALNISILEVARKPDLAIKPRKSRALAMAMVLGLMLGGGLAMLRDWTDQNFRSTEEMTAFLELPVLGIIPRIKAKTVAQCARVMETQPNSNSAESYRTLRTAVFFGIPKGRAKSIVVTSPMEGEGKSTLAANMAIAMAQAGEKTLLLDADFRKATQDAIFKNDGELGLSNIISGGVAADKVIDATQIEGLDLIHCGPKVPNPSEILNSNAFADLIRELSKTYDRIIVDSPPVLAVTDAQILSGTCDITILVVRSNKSTRRESRQARDGLLSVGGKILGLVVNDVSKKDRRYGYYYGYGNYGGSYGTTIGKDADTSSAEKKVAAIRLVPKEG